MINSEKFMNFRGKYSLLIASTIFTVFSPALTSTSYSTVLTFDIANIGDGQSINPNFNNYGDRVTSSTLENYSYGAAGGLTPNIVVDYFTDTSFWTTNYGNLTNVIYREAEGAGILELTLTADPGYEVILNSFDLGGWPNTDYVINSVEVLSGSTSLFSQTNVLIRGFTDPFKTSFTNADFGNSLSASQLTIRFDSTNLGGSSDNIGLDNIQFSQCQVIPEPLTIFGAGTAFLFGTVFKRRLSKKQEKDQTTNTNS